MNWDKAKSALVGSACAVILIAHTPSIFVEPLRVAVAQIRSKNATTDPYQAPAESFSLSDSVGTNVKKLLK